MNNLRIFVRQGLIIKLYCELLELYLWTLSNLLNIYDIIGQHNRRCT